MRKKMNYSRYQCHNKQSVIQQILIILTILNNKFLINCPGLSFTKLKCPCFVLLFIKFFKKCPGFQNLQLVTLYIHDNFCNNLRTRNV